MSGISKLNKIYSTKLKIIQIPKPILFLFSFVIVIGIGILDYFFNTQYNIFLLYLFPVIFISWTRGKLYGFLISFFAISIWFASEIIHKFNFAYIHILIINSILRITVFIIIILILSILNKLFKEIKDESRHDYLTGIPNIRLFYEYAEREINRMKRYNKPFTIVYIDLDNFKQVNDNHGHLEGNRLLKTVAEKIKSNIRAIDIVARIGGDEFILLLPETNLFQSKIVINKIRNELEVLMKKQQWPVTFSIGVVIAINLNVTIEEIIKFADNLMYTVKKTGKNNIMYKEYK